VKKAESSVLEQLLEKINQGQLAQTDNQLVYTTIEGVPMPLTAAASSVKEMAPFTMLLKKFVLSRCSILFEEPEAHLHPERQQYVADLIGYAVNEGCHMQVTTHSDYFVKRLNLLIRLYGLSTAISKSDIDTFLKSIGITCQSLLNPSMTNAYYLSRRNDGSTSVELYDISKYNMIPFDSFNKVIMEDLELSNKVDEFEYAQENGSQENKLEK
ncbi:MAG: AAA family ATPase, partial [Muribaculaceae bacterium]|nr:AAA family ATPase [Muribaculaceae bacterium]